MLFLSVCSWRVDASVQRSVASTRWYYNTKSIWGRVSSLKQAFHYGPCTRQIDYDDDFACQVLSCKRRCFSCKEVQFKNVCLPVKTNCLLMKTLMKFWWKINYWSAGLSVVFSSSLFTHSSNLSLLQSNEESRIFKRRH